MNTSDLKSILNLARRRTEELLESIDRYPDPMRPLAWRPAPGRAHIAWQLMHIAATEDRHLNVRMRGGTPAEPELVRRFAGGSVPDDQIPSPGEIRGYLAARRQALLEHLQSLSADQLLEKPTPDAPWRYEEWFQVLAWHEAHHHGQSHLTLNLYRTAYEPAQAKVGH